LECTHNYNRSYYYSDENEKQKWDGYDAIAQTRVAINYIKNHRKGKPFILFLSWGPPHGPYQTAPEKYRTLYKDKINIALRPNVPVEYKENADNDLSGYYAHIAALDDCMAELLTAIADNNIEDNTILVFTSDHGDMLYSQGMRAKQKPWDESIRVPLLIKYPEKIKTKGRTIDMPIGTPDIMPSLLGLCNLEIPNSVEGRDYTAVIFGEENADSDAALIMLPVPFHQWNYSKGGKEYRGIRTKRYTYAEDLKGPWLLYDNKMDPYQMDNLVDHRDYENLKEQLQSKLKQKLIERNDHFLPGKEYMKKWGYEWYGEDAPSP
jgi:arylsulfatase A-like enzyme